MGRKIRVGEKRNMLLCISEYQEDSIWYLICECDCGDQATIQVRDFGKTQSCGCMRKGTPKHALSGTVEHETWAAMRKRCNSEWHQAYKNYGGRGIKVRERWDNLETGFLNFLEDMGERPSKEHSLDRINVDDDYYKENCRWTDRKTQCNNRRNNVRVEINGVEKTMSEWCEVYEKSVQMVSYRVSKLRMTYQEALETPKITKRGKNKSKEI